MQHSGNHIYVFVIKLTNTVLEVPGFVLRFPIYCSFDNFSYQAQTQFLTHFSELVNEGSVLLAETDE